MRTSKITEKMITLMNNVPSELRQLINVDENDNKGNDLKSLFGLFYSIGNTFNTNTVTLARSKVIEAFGKSINSPDLNSLISRMKDLNLIERIGTSKEGTVYKILFKSFQSEQSQQEQIPTTEETIVETRTIPTADSNNSTMMELILSELKSLNEKIDNLSKENSEFKREILELKTIISTISQSGKSHIEILKKTFGEDSIVNNPTVVSPSIECENDITSAGNTPKIEESHSDEQLHSNDAEMAKNAITEPLRNVKEEFVKGMKKINYIGKGIFITPPKNREQAIIQKDETIKSSNVEERIMDFDPVEFETNPRIIRDNDEFQSVEFCERMIERCEREFYDCDNLKEHLAKLKNKDMEVVVSVGCNDDIYDELPF